MVYKFFPAVPEQPSIAACRKEPWRPRPQGGMLRRPRKSELVQCMLFLSAFLSQQENVNFFGSSFGPGWSTESLNAILNDRSTDRKDATFLDPRCSHSFRGSDAAERRNPKPKKRKDI